MNPLKNAVSVSGDGGPKDTRKGHAEKPHFFFPGWVGENVPAQAVQVPKQDERNVHPNATL